MFLKTDVLKNVTTIKGKTPVLESLFNNVPGLRFTTTPVTRCHFFPKPPPPTLSFTKK